MFLTRREEILMLASAANDALMFAGGQSVPSYLKFAIHLPFTKFFKEGKHTKDLKPVCVYFDGAAAY